MIAVLVLSLMSPPVVCAEGTVPGWLDETGTPTSCVSNDPCPGMDCVSESRPVIIPAVPPVVAPVPPVVVPVDTLPVTGPVSTPLVAVAAVFLALGGLMRKVVRS